MENIVDVLIVGSGVSGLYCALNLDEKLNEKLINNECVLLIDTVENPMNPMRPKSKIIGIKFKDETIDLL